MRYPKLLIISFFLLSCSGKPTIYYEHIVDKYELYTSDYSHLAMVYIYDLNNNSGCRIEVVIYETDAGFREDVKNMYRTGMLIPFVNYYFVFKDDTELEIEYYPNDFDYEINLDNFSRLSKISIISDNTGRNSSSFYDSFAADIRVMWNRMWYDGEFRDPSVIEGYETTLTIRSSDFYYTIHVEGDKVIINEGVDEY